MKLFGNLFGKRNKQSPSWYTLGEEQRQRLMQEITTAIAEWRQIPKSLIDIIPVSMSQALHAAIEQLKAEGFGEPYVNASDREKRLSSIFADYIKHQALDDPIYKSQILYACIDVAFALHIYHFNKMAENQKIIYDGADVEHLFSTSMLHFVNIDTLHHYDQIKTMRRIEVYAIYAQLSNRIAESTLVHMGFNGQDKIELLNYIKSMLLPPISLITDSVPEILRLKIIIPNIDTYADFCKGMFENIYGANYMKKASLFTNPTFSAYLVSYFCMDAFRPNESYFFTTDNILFVYQLYCKIFGEDYAFLATARFCLLSCEVTPRKMISSISSFIAIAGIEKKLMYFSLGIPNLPLDKKFIGITGEERKIIFGR